MTLLLLVWSVDSNSMPFHSRFQIRRRVVRSFPFPRLGELGIHSDLDLDLGAGVGVVAGAGPFQAGMDYA